MSEQPEAPLPAESPILPLWEEEVAWNSLGARREPGGLPGEKGTGSPSPSLSSCGESNNKSEVNPLPGRKLSLKLDEATAVQRESDTKTREPLLIPHRKMGMKSSGPGGETPLCFTRIENTALLRGWDLETQTPRGNCQVEGSPRLPAFTSLVQVLAVMRRRAGTFNRLGQKGFLIRQMRRRGASESQLETTVIWRRETHSPYPGPPGPSSLPSPTAAIFPHLKRCQVGHKRAQT